MPLPKIAVIGAGPGGLCFARILEKSGLPCTVFEAEESRTVRNQGGSLDLHPKAGQRALKAAGLFEEFQKYSRPEGQALKLLRFDGEVLWDENETGSVRPTDFDDRPEIDRVQLRDILLDSLKPDTVKFGTKIARVEADPRVRGKTTIFFADGSKEPDFDLVVGADGAWSKVRPLITDVTPFYSGITAVELWSLRVCESDSWLSNYVGEGSCFMFDEGRAVMAQRNGNDSIRTYACVREPESWQEDCGIDWHDPESARQTLVEKHFSDCSEEVKRLITDCRDALVVRKLWMLPVGLTWESTPGVALIGDSAHVFTPFAGVGVNLAMLDALELAQRLVSRKDGFLAKAFSNAHNIEAAIKDYEKDMFPRAKKYAEKTYEGLTNHFSKTGGEEKANVLKAYYEEQMSKNGQKKR